MNNLTRILLFLFFVLATPLIIWMAVSFLDAPMYVRLARSGLLLLGLTLVLAACLSALFWRPPQTITLCVMLGLGLIAIGWLTTFSTTGPTSSTRMSGEETLATSVFEPGIIGAARRGFVRPIAPSSDITFGQFVLVCFAMLNLVCLLRGITQPHRCGRPYAQLLLTGNLILAAAVLLLAILSADVYHQ